MEKTERSNDGNDRGDSSRNIESQKKPFIESSWETRPNNSNC